MYAIKSHLPVFVWQKSFFFFLLQSKHNFTKSKKKTNNKNTWKDDTNDSYPVTPVAWYFYSIIITLGRGATIEVGDPIHFNSNFNKTRIRSLSLTHSYPDSMSYVWNCFCFFVCVVFCSYFDFAFSQSFFFFFWFLFCIAEAQWNNWPPKRDTHPYTHNVNTSSKKNTLSQAIFSVVITH